MTGRSANDFSRVAVKILDALYLLTFTLCTFRTLSVIVKATCENNKVNQVLSNLANAIAE